MIDELRNKTINLTHMHLIIALLIYLTSLYLVHVISRSGEDYKSKIKESKAKIEMLELENKRISLKTDSISRLYKARRDTIKIIDTLIVYREKRIKYLKEQYDSTKNKPIDTNYNSIVEYFKNYNSPK